MNVEKNGSINPISNKLTPGISASKGPGLTQPKIFTQLCQIEHSILLLSYWNQLLLIFV